MQTLHLDASSSFTIDDNAIYLYPTDSLYGLGCVVTPENIEKIDIAKRRQGGKHYSLITPSIARVIEHFQVDETFEAKWNERYDIYGPLSIICTRRDPNFLSYITPDGDSGIRIIKHPFQDIVSQIGKPFISTSANISGLGYDESQFGEIFADTVDYYISCDVPMTRKPSTLIVRETQKILQR